MNIDEIRDTIRSEFKMLGITNRQVGLTVQFAGYSISIKASIKDFTLNEKMIAEVVNKHRSVSRDERTGEVLEGGNTFVSISYDYDKMHFQMDLRKDRALEIEKQLKSAGNANGIELFETEKYLVVVFPSYHLGNGLGNIHVRDKINSSVRHEFYNNPCKCIEDIQRFLVFYDFQLSKEKV